MYFCFQPFFEVGRLERASSSLRLTLAKHTLRPFNSSYTRFTAFRRLQNYGLCCFREGVCFASYRRGDADQRTKGQTLPCQCHPRAASEFLLLFAVQESRLARLDVRMRAVDRSIVVLQINNINISTNNFKEYYVKNRI